MATKKVTSAQVRQVAYVKLCEAIGEKQTREVFQNGEGRLDRHLDSLTRAVVANRIAQVFGARIAGLDANLTPTGALEQLTEQINRGR